MCLSQGVSRREAAAWRRVSVSTVQYWIDRYRSACDQDRISGAWAEDRPSTPHHQPALSSDVVHDRVCEERRRTGWGPRLIASELQMSHATVSRCLARRGLSRAPKSPRGAVRRFEWPCPGDLLQMDVKRFARFDRPGHRVTGDRYRSGKEKRARVGWEFAHTMIDDHSRLVYTELLGDEQAATVTGFVERALAFYASHPISAKRLQTDNNAKSPQFAGFQRAGDPGIEPGVAVLETTVLPIHQSPESRDSRCCVAQLAGRASTRVVIEAEPRAVTGVFARRSSAERVSARSRQARRLPTPSR